MNVTSRLGARALSVSSETAHHCTRRRTSSHLYLLEGMLYNPRKDVEEGPKHPQARGPLGVVRRSADTKNHGPDRKDAADVLWGGMEKVLG